jgi:hypothetical protein
MAGYIIHGSETNPKSSVIVPIARVLYHTNYITFTPAATKLLKLESVGARIAVLQSKESNYDMMFCNHPSGYAVRSTGNFTSAAIKVSDPSVIEALFKKYAPDYTDRSRWTMMELELMEDTWAFKSESAHVVKPPPKLFQGLMPIKLLFVGNKSQ